MLFPCGHFITGIEPILPLLQQVTIIGVVIEALDKFLREQQNK